MSHHEAWGKVMFLHLCVSHSVHSGHGMQAERILLEFIVVLVIKMNNAVYPHFKKQLPYVLALNQ